MSFTPLAPSGSGGQEREEALLASAYRCSLEIAIAHGCQSIALPALSTGAYAYPVALAAQTALNTVITFLKQQQQLSLVRIVLFDHPTLAVFATALQQQVQQVPFHTCAHAAQG